MMIAKKVLSLLMVILLSVTIIPIQGLVIKADAAYVMDSGSCGTNVTYKLSSDGVLTISGNGKMSDFKNFRDYMFSSGTTPWDKDVVKHIVIESGVTGIGEYAFSDHYYMTDIQIPNSVTTIGKGAFQYCSSLVSLKLPANLTSIPEGMCSLGDLRYVYIPVGVKTIGRSAFYNNYTLLEVEFGGTQTQWNKISIEANNDDLTGTYMSFNNSSALTSTKSGTCGDNVTWKLTTDGTLEISGSGNMDSYTKASVGGLIGNYSKGTDHPWYKYRSKIKKIKIGSGVVSVGAYAFFDCFNCTSLEIQNGVKTIKDGAFAYLPISSVTVPNSVTSLGEYAFYSCSALETATMSDNLTVLKTGMFEYCRNLTSIVLPKNLNTVENTVFYFCGFEELTFPASLTYIGYNFPNINTLRFLGPLPSFDHNEFPSGMIMSDYVYCQPQYYEDFKEIMAKWRAEGVLSDGNICAKLNKNAITLSEDTPTCQLTVSDETGRYTSFTKNWWVEKSKIASVNQSGVVSASGHGETVVHVEISAGGYHSMANCRVQTKRNDLMIGLLPKDLEPDFPVTCGTTITRFGEVDFTGYQPGKLAETNTSNQYYQQLLSLTNSLTSGLSTDTQKARAIWNWVSSNVTYGGSIGIGNQADQAYAVYLNRKAHCEGFAKLTGFMLYLAGIPSCLVASSGHMWNVALLDGTWTMIDSTNKKFGNDYNDYDTIEWIGFGEDDLCFVIDNTEGIKLVGAGNHYLTEERQGYTSIDIPDYVDIIFGSSFALCTNLKNISIPKSVKVISPAAFKDCNKLVNVSYTGSQAQWNAIQIGADNNNLTKAQITFGTSLKSISVKTMPTKTSYYVGDTLNTNGLTLTATYSNGTTSTISSGFSCTPTKLNTAGTQKITVSYSGKTATFNVNVSAVTISSIAIKTNPAKTSYYVGDTLNTSGLTLKAIYSNGTTSTISSGFSCTPTILNTAGTQKITVSYGGKTATFNVNVSAVTISSIAIKTNPAKTSYYVGDTLNTSGLTLKAIYSNGTTSTISSGFSCTPTTLNTAGTQKITVSYSGKTATFNVNVINKDTPNQKVKSVSINDISLNYKSSAKLNPSIDADSGVKYKVEYKSSNTKVATVDNNGNVYAAKKGTATITCTVTDEYGNIVKDTCTVNVNYAWWQWIIKIVLFGWIWY